jgi:hypothetical protein
MDVRKAFQGRHRFVRVVDQEPGLPVFQHLAQVFIGRTGVSRGLQHDEGLLSQVAGDVFAGLEDIAVINVPRREFSQATGETVRRAANKRQ